eukprot:1149356-Pelagomonas_calceolata.AAC.2
MQQKPWRGERLQLMHQGVLSASETRIEDAPDNAKYREARKGTQHEALQGLQSVAWKGGSSASVALQHCGPVPCHNALYYICGTVHAITLCITSVVQCHAMTLHYICGTVHAIMLCVTSVARCHAMMRYFCWALCRKAHPVHFFQTNVFIALCFYGASAVISTH